MNPDKLTDVQLALRPHRITGPVMAAFLDAAAIQPRAAIRFRPATPEADAEFRRLLANGALKNYGDGYWFDLRAHYAVENARATRRAVIGVAIGLAIAVIATLFYQG